MIKQVFVLLFILFSIIGFSQVENTTTSDIFSELKNNSNGGKIKIYENPTLRLEMEKHMDAFSKKQGIEGYRIQIFFGSSKSARRLANEARVKFISSHSKTKAHLEYTNPYFKVRVGDFRTQSEAVKFLQEISNEYPEAFVVEDIIEIE